MTSHFFKFLEDYIFGFSLVTDPMNVMSLMDDPFLLSLTKLRSVGDGGNIMKAFPFNHSTSDVLLPRLSIEPVYAFQG